MQPQFVAWNCMLQLGTDLDFEVKALPSKMDKKKNWRIFLVSLASYSVRERQKWNSCFCTSTYSGVLERFYFSRIRTHVHHSNACNLLLFFAK